MDLLLFLEHIDIQMLWWIREASLMIPFMGLIVRVFADLQPLLFAIFLIALWCYGISLDHDGPRHVALDLFWHVMGAFVLYWCINQLLPLRPRPELILDLPPLINHLPDNSFPSGHAMFWWASWWATKHLLNRKQVTHFFFWTGLITCTTRVIAGIHYPGDIIVGFLLWWGILEVLLRIPHHGLYRRYAHDLPISLAKRLWL